METERAFTIRHYQPSDYQLMLEWWTGHGAEPVHESMIPVSTCIVLMDGEPCASGSVYPCNNNHVAFFHGMVTRPGMTVVESKEAIQALQAGLDIIMRAGGHTLLLGTVPAGAMVRGARSLGFSIGEHGLMGVSRLVTPLTSQNNGL